MRYQPGTPPPFTKSAPVSETAADLTKELEVRIYPNPGTTVFNLQVITAGKEEIMLRVLDLTGRLYKQMNVMPFQTIQLGSTLKPGMYMIEVNQGKERKVLRVVKF